MFERGPAFDSSATLTAATGPAQYELCSARERQIATTDYPDRKTPLASGDGDFVPKEDPELEAAIRQGKASFAQWASAWFYSRLRFNPDSRSRARWAKYRDGGLFAAFVASEGRIVDSYYCDDVPSAAALTLKRRSSWSRIFHYEEPTLHILDNAPSGTGTDSDAQAALTLISGCDRLASRAADYLPLQPRRHFLNEIYGLATDALFILNEAAVRLSRAGSDTAPAVETDGRPGGYAPAALERSTSLSRDLDSAARNASQFYFLRGVILGTLIVGLIAWIVYLIFPAPFSARDAAWTVAWGAVGAAASVLVRIRSSGLKLDYEVGRARLFLLGAIRPLLGAISGLLLFFALVARIIPIAAPAGGAQRVAIYVVSAFGAGFNERWVQDMLANVGTRLRDVGTSASETRAEQSEAAEDGSRRAAMNPDGTGNGEHAV